MQLIYDLIGIGIGPFNLSLAAILYDLPELSALFLEQAESFNWHPGLLLPASRMQVPHYADLVTIVNPQSPFTYHNYLQKTGGFLRYANQDTIFPLRIEYNRYCQWVASQLSSLRYNHRCTRITYNESTRVYTVYTRHQTFHAKHIVLGTGTTPYLPPTLTPLAGRNVHHAAHYLYRKQELLRHKHITILGSGQSAAEIFQDLLPHTGELDQLTWITRSHRFHPMDYSPLTTEMTSLDYIDHFYDLDDTTKAEILEEQHYLFKGINATLIAQINDALYIRRASNAPDNIRILTNCELLSATTSKLLAITPSDHQLHLSFRHRETAYCFPHETDTLIAATGYHYQVPDFLDDLEPHIDRKPNGQYNVQRNYSIDRHNSLFVLNADLHSHGFNSADLALGPYRNATILNTVLGQAHFQLERDTTHQTFGHPTT